MKKSTKIFLTAIGGVALVSGISAGIIVMNNKTNITDSNINNDSLNKPSKPIENNVFTTETHSVTNNDGTTSKVTVNANSAAFSLKEMPSLARSTFDKVYVLRINQVFEKGKVLLYNEQDEMYTNDMPVRPGDKVKVKFQLDKGYETLTLTKIKVWSNDKNYRLATEKVGDDYFFTLPEATATDWEGNVIANPFYNEEKTITVEPEFNTSSLNDWTYDFNTKAYTFKITDEIASKWEQYKIKSKGLFVGNSKKYSAEEKALLPNLDMKFLGEYEKDDQGNIVINQYGNRVVKENTHFMIDLNGYDLYLSDLIIPSGVTLAFHNSQVNQFTQQGNTSHLYGDKRYSNNSVDMHGGMIFAHGVQRMTLAEIDPLTGQYVDRENWWIEGYPGDYESHGTNHD